MKKLANRQQAGILLAKALLPFANRQDVIVLALPRGGVPVAYEIAAALNAPLDILLVRKLGVPHMQELALGAVASDGTLIFNQDILTSAGLSKHQLNDVIAAETKELQRRETAYRGSRPFPELNNKTIILVDDGIATGATMRAALEFLHQHKPAELIIAVPVVALSVFEELCRQNKIICLHRPLNFTAVGLWYEDFSQTTDDEVTELLIKGL